MKKTTKEKLTSKAKGVFSSKKDWTEIHFDFFSAGLKKEWKEKRFSYEQTKEWIEAGLQTNDASFAQWLKEIKKVEAKRVRDNSKELRKEYENFLGKDANNSENPLEPNNFQFKLCSECQRSNTGTNWCQSCNAKHFKEEFKNWTSGNPEIDKFIQECQLEATDKDRLLEWISYDKFTDIKYLAEGGFGKVYKAYWVSGYITSWDIKNSKWVRSRSEYSKRVVLKILHNSQNITTEFLQEIANHKLVSDNNSIVKCYGISHDLEGNYLMVMEYMEGGSLRKYLDNNYGKLFFFDKLGQLCDIAKGLSFIHQKELVHRDFHSGNILNEVVGENVLFFIADLGLSKLSSKSNDGKIVGVLPYVSPEVLTKKAYSEASDIYSFGMIMYEILTGLPPFHNLSHDEFLTIKICQGLRPNFKQSKVKIPHLLEDLIEGCWDANPVKRPTAGELSKVLNDWHEGKDTEFINQYKEAKEFNKLEKEKRTRELLAELYKRYKGETIEIKPEETEKVKDKLYLEFCRNHKEDAKETKERFEQLFSKANNLNYVVHPSAVYTSRLLDFPNLPEPQNSKEINEEFYSGTTLSGSTKSEYSNSSLQFDFAKQNLEKNLQIPPKST